HQAARGRQPAGRGGGGARGHHGDGRGRMIACVLALLLSAASVKSGLQVGEAVPSWQPVHVAGPDRGKRACPTCTYGARPMIQVFTKDGANAGLLAEQIEQLVASDEKRRLKG